MTVCKFYQQGVCRFGERCRFEHPGKKSQAGQNRFGLLQNSGSGDLKKSEPWNFNPKEFRDELTAGKGRPNWILSAYGPVKQGPASLLKDLEWSPEELRVEFYRQAALGNQDAADQQAIQTWNNALKEIKNAYDNADNVVEFLKDADSQQKRPSRYDMCGMDGTETVEQFKSSFNQSSQPESSSNSFGSGMFGKPAFGSSPSSSSSPFVKPSGTAFGQPSTPSFGAGMFGKPAAATTAFGQPAFGSTGFGQEKKNPFSPASASTGFGQGGSPFGQQPSSTFGQPSQPTSTFGPSSQPSPFGQRTEQTPAFGQPSKPGSTFGQPSLPTSAFGKPSQTSAFGQPSQPSSAFGQPSQPGSAFGQLPQPSPFSNPFGSKPSQSTPAFGQPSQPSSGFGQTGFGQTGFGTSPAPAFGSGMFGKEASTTAPVDQDMDATSPVAGTHIANPFAKPPSAPISASQLPSQPQASGQPISNPVGSSQSQIKIDGTSAPIIYAQTLPLIPSQKADNGQLTSYRGQRVTYIQEPIEHDQFGNQKPATFYPCYERRDRQDVEKIWFPDGANDEQIRHLNKDSKRKDLEAEDDEYTAEIKEMYQYLKQEGAWRGCKVPLVPPMRQWVDYDF